MRKARLHKLAAFERFDVRRIQIEPSPVLSLVVYYACLGCECRLQWDDFVLSRLALLDQIDCVKCRHFSAKVHTAQRVEFADEGQGHWVIEKVVAADTVSMQSQQVLVKAPNDGDEVHAILHGIGVSGGSLLDRVGTGGDGNSVRHELSPRSGR